MEDCMVRTEQRHTIPEVFDYLRGLLENVEMIDATSFSASCPNHDDNEFSLYVELKSNDRIGLSCSSGCDTHAIAQAIDDITDEIERNEQEALRQLEALGLAERNSDGLWRLTPLGSAAARGRHLDLMWH
jgi:hypothetical protein